jgi:hypothetical protein
VTGPTALRFLTRAPGGRAPKPPFGISAWSPTADDVGVVLEAPFDELHAIPNVAEQLPRASTLASGTTVFVLGAAPHPSRVWRLLGRAIPVSRATRCTALLVMGYVEIGAGGDKTSGYDLAWGSAP